MEDSIDRCSTFGWTKDVDWDAYASELDHDAPEPKPRRVIRGRGRWGVGIHASPTPVKGCGVRAINHHMKHSPSSKRSKSGAVRAKQSGRERDRNKNKKKKTREKKKKKYEKMIKRKKNKKDPPKDGCEGQSRMSVDDVSRESRHDNYHRLRLRKIYHPQLRAKLSFSSRSWDPNKVEAATSDLASMGYTLCCFAACSKRQSPLLQSYLGPLAGLVAASKCIYRAFLPNLNPHTVSDDFEVLSRAFPQHCNILNESSIVSSITMFRHASSDHHRARPAPMLRNTDGCASHAPLIIFPDIDEHGVPKLGVILARTVTNAVQKPSHPKIKCRGHLDPPLPGIRRVCPHQTLLRELNGPTPRSEKLDSLGKDASKRRRARVQLRLGRGASVNPVVGLRSPAQSYCRSSRPAMKEKFLPIQHPKIWNWGFALSP